MEWAPFKILLWKSNDSIANLTISFTSGLSLWDKPCYENMLIYDSDKNAESLQQNNFLFDCRADTGFCFGP